MVQHITLLIKDNQHAYQVLLGHHAFAFDSVATLDYLTTSLDFHLSEVALISHPSYPQVHLSRSNHQQHWRLGSSIANAVAILLESTSDHRQHFVCPSNVSMLRVEYWYLASVSFKSGWGDRTRHHAWSPYDQDSFVQVSSHQRCPELLVLFLFSLHLQAN